MKHFFRFLFSRSFFLNLFIIGLLIVGGIWSLFYWMGQYTDHSQSIEVPSFYGQPLDSLDQFAAKHNLQYVILDSVYDNRKSRGTVLNQTPPEGFKVKQNRKIYLTVNGFSPERRPLPPFAGTTFRQYKAAIGGYWELDFEPGEGEKGQVLEVRYQEEKLDSGDLIIKGKKLTLVIGEGMTGGQVPIPDLIGFTYVEVEEYLTERGLNLGVITMLDCETEGDSILARVLDQDPEFDETKAMSRGRAIQLTFSLDAPVRQATDSLLQNDSIP